MLTLERSIAPAPPSSARDAIVPVPPQPPAAPRAGVVAITAEELRTKLAGHPREHIEELEWFRHYCVLRNLTWENAARLLHKENRNPYNRNTLMQAMAGMRATAGSLTAISEAIGRFRANVDAPVPTGGFFPTRVYQLIKAYVEMCIEEHAIGFVVGDNAIGKTTARNELARLYPNITGMRMPEGGHLTAFSRELARKRGKGDRQTIQNLSRALIDEFHPGDALLIDEADEIFRARTTLLGAKTVSFVRRLWEEAGIAIIMIVDKAGWKRLREVTADDVLRRAHSRRMEPLLLKSYYDEDLAAFAAQRGLEPAPDQPVVSHFVSPSGQKVRYEENPAALQHKVCGSHKDGLFIWLRLLNRAKKWAEADGKTVSWAWVLKAYALHIAMEEEAAR